MKLAQNLKGISKLAFLLLMVIFFLLGGIFSYIYTMGFYAPGEFNVPSHSLAIEDVHFSPENAFVFNVTVLNPSYSASNAIIDRIKVSTSDGRLHSINYTLPELPLPLSPGKSQTIRNSWDWGNYTGQTLEVYVLTVGSSGATVKAKAAFMNFSVTDVNLDPSLSVNNFNITVQNAGSSTPVNITKILVNGTAVSTVPNLTPPYTLTNATDAPPVQFTLMKNWTDLQGKTVSIEVQTSQGYRAFKNVNAPPPTVLRVTDVDFNVNYTDRFNVTVQNTESSPRKFVDISEIKLLTETVTIVPNASLPQKLQWNSSITLTCFWNWSSYEGKNVTIVVLTLQGFTMRDSITIIPNPKVSFIRWADGVRVGTFDYSVDVAPNVKITNENVTHGVWNWDTVNHTAHLRISNITNPAYIQNVTIYVKLGNETIATVVWNNSESLPTSWVSFSVNASTKYAISIEIATTPDAVVGQTSVVTVQTKTNP